MRVIQALLMALLFVSGTLKANEPIREYDFSAKKFIKVLGQKVSKKTKHHYLRLKSLAASLGRTWPVGIWVKSGSWELDFMEHKINLNYPLSKRNLINHNKGLDTMTINRAWQFNNVTYRIGVGTVSSNYGDLNESLARNDLLPRFHQKEFSIDGIASQSSVQTRIHLNRDVYLTIAGKLMYANGTSSKSKIDINQRSVHLIFGLNGFF